MARYGKDVLTGPVTRYVHTGPEVNYRELYRGLLESLVERAERDGYFLEGYASREHRTYEAGYDQAVREELNWLNRVLDTHLKEIL